MTYKHICANTARRRATLLYVFHAVVNACKSNPCKHGGNCSTNGIDYMCTCVTGYEGDDCDEGRDCIPAIG